MSDWICGKKAHGWSGVYWFWEKDAYVFRSSANILYQDDRPEAMELMNMVNRIGPSIEPCGTPLRTGRGELFAPFTDTCVHLPKRNGCIQLKRLAPEAPSAGIFVASQSLPNHRHLNFSSNILWGTTSKALLKSNSASGIWPSSVALYTSLYTRSSYAAVECPALKPNWFAVMMSLSSTYSQKNQWL